jgi:hypothetical protein
MFIEGEPLIDDLCIVLQSGPGGDIEREDIPDEYQEVEKCALTTPINVHPSNATGAQSQMSFVIGYHQRAALGLCDLGYDSATLDRYPLKVSLRRFSITHNYVLPAGLWRTFFARQRAAYVRFPQ